MIPSDWRARLPSALLILLAGTQLLLVQQADLTPWLGGGFGMFSTTDSPGARHVHVFSITPGVEREVVIGDAFRELTRRAAALPSEANLAALARALESVPTPEGADSRRTMRVQVWRTHFDRERFTPSSELLRQREFKLQDD